MKKLELTGKQAYELKWFCENVVGVRQDYYDVLDRAISFDARLKRLEKTCAIIEDYFSEKLKSPFDNYFGDATNETMNEIEAEE